MCTKVLIRAVKTARIQHVMTSLTDITPTHTLSPVSGSGQGKCNSVIAAIEDVIKDQTLDIEGATIVELQRYALVGTLRALCLFSMHLCAMGDAQVSDPCGVLGCCRTSATPPALRAPSGQSQPCEQHVE
jgi:hypothetical protein